MVAVDEHSEPTEDAQTKAELQKQTDGLQSQITDMHRAREITGENPDLSSEVQSLRDKLDEHSKQLEQSAEKLSQIQSENTVLRDQNQALNMVGNKKRHFNTPIRPMGNLNTPSTRGGTTDTPPTSGVAGATREGTENPQIHDLEESDSEPEPGKEAPERTAATESSITAYPEQIFSKRFDAMQFMVERLPGVAPPIRRSNLDSYADTPSWRKSSQSRCRESSPSPASRCMTVLATPTITSHNTSKGCWRLHSLRNPAKPRCAKGLSDKFVEQFASSRSLEKTSDGLYEIHQHRVEPMRDYIARFNQEKVAVPE
ncbi:hypothetical protein F2Q69_00048443 [Brassica cretica]|uniref:Retrotransposon gag domain-containing protein n=1 Tax=Brassica cretica TaxID=69181 RepID=A0A8S9Q8L4_BRACR|nr:hypothetical protein F2Q69_00048443 [Brassica cretica]